jgi:hypothetical protein
MNFLTLSQLILEGIKVINNSFGCRSHVQGEIEQLKNLLIQGTEFLKNEHEKSLNKSQGELNDATN